VRHPPSEARFVRVTLLHGAAGALRITGARAALRDAPDAPLGSIALSVPAAKRSPDGRETFLDLDLSAPGIPVEAIDLEAGDAAFERRVRVHSSTDGAHWIPSGGGVVWRAPLPAGAFPAAPRGGAENGLRIAAATQGRRWIRVAFEDGDSPPLRVTALRALWRPRSIVFRAEAPGRHALLVGADVPAPAYDLAALLARTSSTALPLPARLGAASPNARFREPVKDVPLSDRHPAALVAALAVVFAALAFWAVRLLRGAPRGGEGA
jgi:hypothetical protein